ncbi:MAG: polyprenyl synthetase family protein [Candidatus Omnitrophota bacterium]|jgi:geranylgeranyl diphosphate synthase type I
MFLKIKKKVNNELKGYAADIRNKHSLRKISPLLYDNIKEFVSREGKRVRPILFIMGYMGYARKAPKGLYRAAVSLELLHDFMLVHDDIIDRSSTRRGKPSMHAMLNHSLAEYKNIKFTGEDLAIVLGDVLYAMAIHSFLSVKEELLRKESALKKLVEAAFLTGSGEFIELLAGAKDIARITRNDIYKIYDLKTSNYTFAAPLTIGATLAGAKKEETDKLYEFGISLGRAFQIKDDMIGIFSSSRVIGKSILTDLKESKKTILIWHAYNHADKKGKLAIRKILSKDTAGLKDLSAIRRILKGSGTPDFAREEINILLDKALAINSSTRMRPEYKKCIADYSRQVLKI